MKKLLLLGLLALTQPVMAEQPANPMYDNLIKMTMQNFWGRATIKQGAHEVAIQPESEAERNQLPIKKVNAYAVLDAGQLSAQARWCGLNWEQHYAFITGTAKKNYMNDKQMAFIGVLHGIAMQIAEDSLQGKCSESKQQQVIAALNESIANPIEFSLSLVH